VIFIAPSTVAASASVSANSVADSAIVASTDALQTLNLHLSVTAGARPDARASLRRLLLQVLLGLTYIKRTRRKNLSCLYG